MRKSREECEVKFVLFTKARYTPREKYIEDDPQVLEAIQKTRKDHQARFVHRGSEVVKILWNEYYGDVELASYRCIATFLPETAIKRKRRNKRRGLRRK